MPSLIRITGWFSLFFGLIIFFVLQGRLDLISQIAGGVVLLSILAILMFTGNQKLLSPPPKSVVEETGKVEVTKAHFPQINELEIVDSEKEEKLERSRKKSSLTPPPMPQMPPPSIDTLSGEVSKEDMPTLPPPQTQFIQAADGTKLAKKLIITSDAQSEMESEIENFVDQRRSRQAEIRLSLERKRRMALAERRAAKARLWTEVEDGEDLAKLLSDPNHGLTIIEETEEYDDSKPQGVSYVRIDNTRILKLTIPLVVENKSKKEEENKSDTLSLDSEIPTPPGLPPMPPPPGLPPMPPPPGLPPMPPPNFEKE